MPRPSHVPIVPYWVYPGYHTGLNSVIKLTNSDKPVQGANTHIWGCDLLNIANREEICRISRKKLKSGGWTKLANEANYTIFCSDLGDAVIPDPCEDKLCQQCLTIPWHTDFLCAYVSYLAELLARGGENEASKKLLDVAYNQKLYQQCEGCPQEKRVGLTNCLASCPASRPISCVDRHVKAYNGLLKCLKAAPGMIFTTLCRNEKRTYGSCTGAVIIGQSSNLRRPDVQRGL